MKEKHLIKKYICYIFFNNKENFINFKQLKKFTKFKNLVNIKIFILLIIK